MKRTVLIRTITAVGCVLIRHGAKHDWYRNPKTGVAQPVEGGKRLLDARGVGDLRAVERDVVVDAVEDAGGEGEGLQRAYFDHA